MRLAVAGLITNRTTISKAASWQKWNLPMPKTEFTGHLVSEPKGYALDGGSIICNFRVLVENAGSEQPIRFSLAVQGELRKSCEEFLSNGHHVYIEGALRDNPETGNPHTYSGTGSP